ncbi:unnamed protein product [Schistosoma bovis]|nr:unnamed protein product [Schistosoma bovis]
MMSGSRPHISITFRKSKKPQLNDSVRIMRNRGLLNTSRRLLQKSVNQSFTSATSLRANNASLAKKLAELQVELNNQKMATQQANIELLNCRMEVVRLQAYKEAKERIKACILNVHELLCSQIEMGMSMMNYVKDSISVLDKNDSLELLSNPTSSLLGETVVDPNAFDSVFNQSFTSATSLRANNASLAKKLAELQVELNNQKMATQQANIELLNCRMEVVRLQAYKEAKERIKACILNVHELLCSQIEMGMSMMNYVKDSISVLDKNDSLELLSNPTSSLLGETVVDPNAFDSVFNQSFTSATSLRANNASLAKKLAELQVELNNQKMATQQANIELLNCRMEVVRLQAYKEAKERIKACILNVHELLCSQIEMGMSMMNYVKDSISVLDKNDSLELLSNPTSSLLGETVVDPNAFDSVCR